MVGYHAKPHAPDQKSPAKGGASQKRLVRHRINDIVQSACDGGIFGNATSEREGVASNRRVCQSVCGELQLLKTYLNLAAATLCTVGFVGTVAMFGRHAARDNVVRSGIYVAAGYSH